MSALEYWTLTATLTAVNIDYVDSDLSPDLQRISGTVEIIPRLPAGALIWAPGLTPKQGLALSTIRARFDTDGVLRTIVAGAIDEQQTVTITGSPTGGTFTLTFNGQTTAAIAYNASAATIDTRLEALSNVGAGNITVGGSPGGPWVVSFAAAMGGADQPQMTATSSLTGGTTPAVTVTTTRPGTLGAGVQLVANTNAIDLDELYFDLKFSDVVYNRADQDISPFAILAPTTGGVTVDLADAIKFPPKPGL